MLAKFASLPTRLADRDRYWTAGFHERNASEAGTIQWSTHRPASLDECVLQGPHILNGTPLGQEPRENYKNNADWDPVSLEDLPADFVPRTNYERSASRTAYESQLATWGDAPYTARFREAHRQMIGSGLVRTIQAALLPPGPAQTGSLATIARSSDRETVIFTGLMTSLPYDYLIKVNGASNLKKNMTDRLPVPDTSDQTASWLLLRTLRLNTVTAAYSEVWNDLFEESWLLDHFVAVPETVVSLEDVGPAWAESTLLRYDVDRWAALTEIDAVVALLLGITDDQLVQIYRSQFPVLRKYESQMVFDSNGRQICGDYHAYGFKQAEWEAELKAQASKPGSKKMKMWDRVQAYQEGDTSIDLGPFAPPFTPADRETAMRNAYQAFSERLKAADK